MKNEVGGVRAWLVETWHGGEDEPYGFLEVKRQLFINKRIAYDAYDRAVTSGEEREAVLSEVVVIPGRILIKGTMP